MNRKWTALVLAVLLSAAATACAKQDGGLRKVTLVFDWIPNTNYVGAYVAKEKGWFAEEGLDVDFQQAPDGSYIEMVALGKGDFAYAAQESLSQAEAGDTPLPVVAVATLLQHNTSGFASPASKGIREPKDFEGRTYSGWGTDLETGIIAALMRKQGADPSTVRVVSLEATDFFATVEKDADFAWIYYGEDGITAEERGFPLNFIRFQDVDPSLDFYTPILIGNSDAIAADPDLARRFLRAMAKGYAFAAADPAGAADILCAAVPEIDRTHAIDSITYLAREYFDADGRWGVMKASVWNGFTGWLHESGVIARQLDVSTLYRNDLLP
jgi:ABC-type nitrate/sulfonate/bicarbonate transport system substrate-binding protein